MKSVCVCVCVFSGLSESFPVAGSRSSQQLNQMATSSSETHLQFILWPSSSSLTVTWLSVVRQYTLTNTHTHDKERNTCREREGTREREAYRRERERDKRELLYWFALAALLKQSCNLHTDPKLVNLNEREWETKREMHTDREMERETHTKTCLTPPLSRSLWWSGGGDHAGPLSRTMGAVCSELGAALGVAHLSAGYGSS